MRARAETIVRRTSMAAAIVLLGFPALLFAYSEEDWRAYSRSKVELVDTFNLPFEAAGPFVLLGDKLVFLSKGRDSLISLDTTTRAVADRARIASDWNMDISAMTAYDGKLYLLSRSTRAIYCYEPEREGWASKVLLDLGKVQFDGEPMLTTFAYDGEHVYMVVLAGFATHVARVSPNTAMAQQYADADGTRMALACHGGKVYYLAHRSVRDASPSLAVFDGVTPAEVSGARLMRYLELPCPPSTGLGINGNRLWVMAAGGASVVTVILRNDLKSARGERIHD
jgi:hypothetical protein